MSALICLTALTSALLVSTLRWPSEWLFEEAHAYYAAAEMWRGQFDDPHANDERRAFVRDRYAACLRDAHRLTRKAIRRMPWRLL